MGNQEAERAKAHAGAGKAGEDGDSMSRVRPFIMARASSGGFFRPISAAWLRMISRGVSG